MVKHFILILSLTALGVMFRNELVHALDGLVLIHNYIAQTLHLVFSNDQVGRLIQDMVSLLAIPLVAGFCVAIIFWILKKAAMPHTISVIWVLWLILVTTMLAQTHFVPPASGASQGREKAEAPIQGKNASEVAPVISIEGGAK